MKHFNAAYGIPYGLNTECYSKAVKVFSALNNTINKNNEHSDTYSTVCYKSIRPQYILLFRYLKKCFNQNKKYFMLVHQVFSKM